MHKAFVQNIVTEGLLRAGDRVLVAVSGGLDSTALLHLLHACRQELSVSLAVAHLDHGIRADSAADCAFVQGLCRDYDLPFHCRRVEVPALAGHRRQGVEETARQERHSFLRQTALRHGYTAIALGHHRGDQLETMLHRLLRGAGPGGLSAMAMRSGLLVRPLLPFSRSRIESYHRGHRLAHVEDGSNHDCIYTRNRIRHRLVPLLEEFNPAVEEGVARLCRTLDQEEDFWAARVEEALALIWSPQGEGGFLQVGGLRSLHPALRRRVLRQALCRVRGDLRGIASVHIDMLDGLVAGGPSQGELYLPGSWAGRRYERLWLATSAPEEARPFCQSIEGPGRWPLACGGVLTVTLERARGEGPFSAEFDPAAVAFPLLLRSFSAGDRFNPSGMQGRKKLKDFFIDAKIDRSLRRRLPLLVVGDEVVWIPGVRRSGRYRPPEGGGEVLRVSLSECPLFDNRLVNTRGL